MTDGLTRPSVAGTGGTSSQSGGHADQDARKLPKSGVQKAAKNAHLSRLAGGCPAVGAVPLIRQRPVGLTDALTYPQIG